MTLRKGLLAATMLALPMAAAQAQPVTGLYIGAGVGANFRMTDDSAKFGTGFGTTTGSIETNTGWVALGAVGWGFGNGLRVELEGNYRQNDGRGNLASARTVATGTAAAPTSTSISTFGQNGQFQTYGAMVNALYDFNMGWPVVPYVGIGVGIAWADYSGARVVTTATTRTAAGALVPGSSGTLTSTVDDTTAKFAYQAILGMAYSLGAMVPGLALTAEYRFFGTL
ncbi:MAG: P44/Msp2 family outer membrane protein, partial [Acetobacteraceae bacterium]|nr:P44/Msp2 family outer membrane protein [Acetobacteraceae bacterium]